MARITTSVWIARAPADVFSYLTDLRNAKEWSTELVDVSYDGELARGTTGSDTRTMGRKQIVMPWRVTDFEPPKRLALSYEQPFPIDAAFVFEAGDGGTQVTCVTHLRPQGFWRLLAPILAWEGKKTDRVQFDRVKAILEGAAGTAAVTSQRSST